jgi:hypothetical protein
MAKQNLVKENLQLYIPSLMEMVGENDLNWDDIDNKFEKRIQQRIKEINESEQESMIIQASIYDIIVEAKKNSNQAKGLLVFLNRLFSELNLLLSIEAKRLIKSNIWNMLTALDTQYLNFTGEIAVLNNLIKSGMYDLADVEPKLPNGKTIDFKLRRISDNKFLLVEVFNIHVDSSRVDPNQTDIHKFLSHRISKKIAIKGDGLPSDLQFFLVPVIWGGLDAIKVYSEYFQKNKLEIANICEPVSFAMRSDGMGYYEHRFGNVSNLLEFL